MVKAGVIGVGNVGSCIAFKLAVEALVDELVLLDVVKPLAEGQAMDIQQASALTSNTEVKAGDYGDLADADFVVITAGKPRTPSMKSRLELACTNAKIVADIALKLRNCDFDGFLITVTNPVDLMNLLTWKVTGLDRFKVLGSSSLLDTSRFRVIIAERFKVKPKDVDGCVIGEHGRNQVPLFSRLRIMGRPVKIPQLDKMKIVEELRDMALSVISRKGATVYAPVNCTVALINSLIRGEGISLASLVLDGEYGVEGVSIGVPFQVGHGAAKGVIEWSLDDWETSTFLEGVSTLKEAWENIKELIKLQP